MYAIKQAIRVDAQAANRYQKRRDWKPNKHQHLGQWDSRAQAAARLADLRETGYTIQFRLLLCFGKPEPLRRLHPEEKRTLVRGRKL